MLLLLLAGGSTPPAPVAPPSSGYRPRRPAPAIPRESEDEEIVAVIAAMRHRMLLSGGTNQMIIRAPISVPAYVQRNAQRGLKFYEDGRGGDGLVPATIEDARQMAHGSVTEAKLRKMGPWISRHLVDFDAPKNSDARHPDYPGPGLVAMLLWGAGPDREGAQRTLEWVTRKVAQIDTP